MYEFQLYRNANDNFPTEIKVGEIVYPINTDYRVILKILRIQEQKNVSQAARNLKTLDLFYVNGYPKDNPFFYFSMFASRCKTEIEQSNEQPVMDYFVDADVIYTSFKAQYGIDLIRVDYLHWYDFIMLMQGLGENTPLQERIRIRTMDTSKLKGDDLTKAQRAKKRVALPCENTEAAEKILLQRFGMG